MSDEARAWAARHSPYRGATYQIHLVAGEAANDLDSFTFGLPFRALAAKARVGVASAKRATDELMNDGYIEQLQPPGKGPGKTGRYRFLFPDVPVVWDSRVVPPPNNSAHPIVPPRNNIVPPPNNSGDRPHSDEEALEAKSRARLQPSEAWSLTPELKAWAAAKFPAVDVEQETESFLDYNAAIGREPKSMAAAWRNWIRNVPKFAGRGQAGQMRMSNEDAMQEAMRRDGLL